MGRMINLIGVMTLFHIVLAIVVGYDILGSAMYQYFTGNLADWGAAEIFDYLRNDILALISGAGIVAGLYLIRNDFAVYASVAIAMYTWGASYAGLYASLLASGAFGGSPLALSMVFAPLMLLWGMLLLEFARGRD